MTSPTLKFGLVCQLKDDPSVTWRIVGLPSDGSVELSGPGPCRSIKSVMRDDFNRGWEIVS